jgi:hypothetical protein
MCPCSPNNLDIHGIALRRQVAFTEYARNIGYFIAATDSGLRHRVDGRPFGPPPVDKDMLPFKPPPVNFALLKELPATVTDKFTASLGPGSSSNVVGKGPRGADGIRSYVVSPRVVP